MASTLIWGTMHTTSKVVLRELSAGQLALLRPLLACVTLVAVSLATGRVHRLVAELRRDPGLLLTLGVLGYAFSGGFTMLALQYLPAGITSVLTNTSPLLLIGGLALLHHQPVHRIALLGAVLGLAGVVILGLEGAAPLTGLSATLLGVLFATGSAAAWAIYTVLARRLAGADPLTTTAITSAVGTVAVATVAVPTQDWSVVMHASTDTLLGVVWVGVVATGATYLGWSYALRHLPASQVAPFAYLIPTIGLIISNVVLGEPLTLAVISGAALVLAGVALTQAAAYPRARSRVASR